MRERKTEIRLALPSKGRLAEGTLSLLEAAGLPVRKSTPRRLQASIPSLPQLTVLFQRAADIPVSVRDGAVDLGITGWDLVRERGPDRRLLTLLPRLGFGRCRLNLIVPESWRKVKRVSHLARAPSGPPLRVATKFPSLTAAFLARHGVKDVRLVPAEGTLEIAPAIGYADMIADLVSRGTTLRENHLKLLEDGCILESEACLVAGRRALKSRPCVLAAARTLVEFLVAHLRAADNLSLFVNIRAENAEQLAAVRQPALLGAAARRFGSQCIVLALDARRTGAGGWEVCVNGGRVPTGIDAGTWAEQATRLGAGEILLTSMDADGTGQGYDLELTRCIALRVQVPVIASGGAGSCEHFARVLTDGRADAALAASLFHDGELSIAAVKRYLLHRGIAVRPS